jgi:hypothetical protein
VGAKINNAPFKAHSENDFIVSNEQPPIQKITRQHFIQSDIRKYDLTMSRASISQQIKKICALCNRGFCRRKGRGKCWAVAHNPIRFICLKCLTKFLNAEVAEKGTLEHIGLVKPVEFDT